MRLGLHDKSHNDLGIASKGSSSHHTTILYKFKSHDTDEESSDDNDDPSSHCSSQHDDDDYDSDDNSCWTTDIIEEHFGIQGKDIVDEHISNANGNNFPFMMHRAASIVDFSRLQQRDERKMLEGGGEESIYAPQQAYGLLKRAASQSALLQMVLSPAPLPQSLRTESLHSIGIGLKEETSSILTDTSPEKQHHSKQQHHGHVFPPSITLTTRPPSCSKPRNITSPTNELLSLMPSSMIDDDKNRSSACLLRFDDEYLQRTLFVPWNMEGYSLELTAILRRGDVAALQAYHIQHEQARNERTHRLVLQCSNRFGESIVHLAARRGCLSVLQYLVEQADVSLHVCCDNGRTPLHDACWSHTPVWECVTYIIVECQCAYMLFVTDRRGNSPMQYAPPSTWEAWSAFLQQHAVEIKRQMETFMQRRQNASLSESSTTSRMDDLLVHTSTPSCPGPSRITTPVSSDHQPLIPNDSTRLAGDDDAPSHFYFI